MGEQQLEQVDGRDAAVERCSCGLLGQTYFAERERLESGVRVRMAAAAYWLLGDGSLTVREKGAELIAGSLFYSRQSPNTNTIYAVDMLAETLQ